MAARQPDELAAEARRWLTRHHGPRTRAVELTLHALASYYDDLAVVVGILAWWESGAPLRPSPR